MMFLWPLWASCGALGPPLGGPWRPSGASGSRLEGDLGASLRILESFWGAKTPPRAPKTPPGGLPDTPGGLPEALQRRPRGPQNGPQSIFYCFYDFLCNPVVTLLCFNSGQAECAKRLNPPHPAGVLNPYLTLVPTLQGLIHQPPPFPPPPPPRIAPGCCRPRSFFRNFWSLLATAAAMQPRMP